MPSMFFAVAAAFQTPTTTHPCGEVSRLRFLMLITVAPFSNCLEISTIIFAVPQRRLTCISKCQEGENRVHCDASVQTCLCFFFWCVVCRNLKVMFFETLFYLVLLHLCLTNLGFESVASKPSSCFAWCKSSCNSGAQSQPMPTTCNRRTGFFF